jgi:hypothetical protein
MMSKNKSVQGAGPTAAAAAEAAAAAILVCT